MPRLVAAVAALLAALVVPTAAWAQESATPWIGVGLDTGAKGIVINEVFANTPGQRAGLKAGDEIVGVDGTPVHVVAELLAIEQKRGVGAKLALSVVRAGKTVALTLPLEPRPDDLKLLRDHLVDKAAPGFALLRSQGPYPADLGKLAGQVVVLEFGATWCPACNASIPRMAEWHTRYGKDGLRVISLSNEKAEKVLEHAQKKKIPYTVACDEGAKVTKAYIVPALPTFVVIDRQGVVRHTGVGAGDELDAVESAFTQLLKR